MILWKHGARSRVWDQVYWWCACLDLVFPRTHIFSYSLTWYWLAYMTWIVQKWTVFHLITIMLRMVWATKTGFSTLAILIHRHCRREKFFFFSWNVKWRSIEVGADCGSLSEMQTIFFWNSNVRGSKTYEKEREREGEKGRKEICTKPYLIFPLI